MDTVVPSISGATDCAPASTGLAIDSTVRKSPAPYADTLASREPISLSVFRPLGRKDATHVPHKKLRRSSDPVKMVELRQTFVGPRDELGQRRLLFTVNLTAGPTSIRRKLRGLGQLTGRDPYPTPVFKRQCFTSTVPRVGKKVPPARDFSEQ
jgi:hypothetical protein